MVPIETQNKPFLRWAGGKSWLLKYLPKIMPSSGFRDYYEPFLGSASVFFATATRSNAYLSDLNPELVLTYEVVRDSVQELITALKGFHNDKDSYYSVRSSRPLSRVDRAARFIYLNQTSFNGIYRVNLNGQYNVPYGFRTKDFLDESLLRSSSQLLQNAIFRCDDFTWVSQYVQENDLVFLDPPYTVSHNQNGFIKYNENLFSLDDQLRLARLIDELRSKGAYYILTNAAHATVREIFDRGESVIEIYRQSRVAGSSEKRGMVSEFVFSNTGGTL